ncbi:MAG TPA: DUF4185 domain-containing protein [Trebonia sp.]|jgi:hypothetical protein|nr:DUF4185 domain-containing protein [Trebonia sp.]
MTSRRLAVSAGTFGVVMALALGSPALAASASPGGGASAATPHARTAQPNGGLTVKDFQILGPVDQNSHVVARDNGQSVLYGGKSYWFFDDSELQNPSGFISSSAAVTSDLNASDGITLHSANPFDESDTSTPAEFVPYSAAETRFQNEHAASDCTNSTDPYCDTQFAFWPGATVADPAHHRILVFYGKLCRGGPDNGPCASGFVGQPLGNGIVSVDMRTHQITRLDIENQDPSLTSPEGHDPTQLFPSAQDWGNGGAVLAGNELYAYGQCTSGFTPACGVARVPIDQVQNHAAWRFYAGQSNGKPVWSGDAADAVTVMNGGPAGETVYYDPTTKLYWDTYLPYLSQQAYYSTAPTPWGPWSTPADLYTAGATTGIDYAEFAHPEYTTNHGLTRYYTYYDSATGDQMLVKVDFRKS